jgi:hypothetical protein
MGVLLYTQIPATFTKSGGSGRNKPTYIQEVGTIGRADDQI